MGQLLPAPDHNGVIDVDVDSVNRILISQDKLVTIHFKDTRGYIVIKPTDWLQGLTVVAKSFPTE